MKAVCNALRNCVLRCFRSQEDEYKQRMIQLQQRMLNRDSSKVQPYETDFNSRISGPSMISVYQSPKKPTQPTQSPVKEQPRQASQNRHSNGSADSYFTIHSGSASNYSISRRSFKSIQRKKSFISQQISSKIANDNKLSQFKDMNYQNTNETDLKLSRVQSQYNTISQAMFQWNQNQYQRQENVNLRIQINQSQQLKMVGNIFINQAVNCMEDYYTFFFNQDNKEFVKSDKKEEKVYTKNKGHYFKKYPQFKCSYSCQNENLNAPQTYMLLMIFQSNTSNPVQFLKWYNSSQVQSKLFNIQKQKIIQNGTYPIFNIQQFSPDIKQKYSYLTLRQIQTVKFDSQPDSEYILQLDTTFRKGNWFRRVVRFSDSDFDNGQVQIYCECTQKLRCLPQEYFFKKCKILENLLQDRLLKISMSRVIK